jgi:hypothetical protein
LNTCRDNRFNGAEWLDGKWALAQTTNRGGNVLAAFLTTMRNSHSGSFGVFCQQILKKESAEFEEKQLHALMSPAPGSSEIEPTDEIDSMLLEYNPKNPSPAPAPTATRPSANKQMYERRKEKRGEGRREERGERREEEERRGDRWR